MDALPSSSFTPSVQMKYFKVPSLRTSAVSNREFAFQRLTKKVDGWKSPYKCLGGPLTHLSLGAIKQLAQENPENQNGSVDVSTSSNILLFRVK